MKFDPTRVAIVDHVSSNLIVRGMDPACDGKTFDLKSVLKAVVAAGGDVKGRKLVVVNVIDNAGERWAWAPEVSAFGFDPDAIPASDWPPYVHRAPWDPSIVLATSTLGDLYWWPFEGLPENTDPTVFLHAPGWDFAGCVDLIGHLAQTETNALIYFHCMLGADRTGALHSGYLMRDKGMDLSQAAGVADHATSAGAPNADYVRLRAAYAASLANYRAGAKSLVWEGPSDG